MALHRTFCSLTSTSLAAAAMQWLPALLLIAMSTASHASAPWTTGTAYSVADGQVAYRELHYPAPGQAGLSSRVEYQDAQGRVIVRKQLDFSRSLTAPAIDQVDLRTSTRIYTRYEGARLQASYQRDAGSAMRTDTLRPRPELIVDAGFDPFVRAHWDSLLAGRPASAEFFLPALLRTITVSIAPVARAECEQVVGDVLCLMVRPAGLLRVASWFVEPLRLAYDLDERRLLMFRGPSNLLDAQGQAQDVLVLFEYHAAQVSASALIPPAGE